MGGWPGARIIRPQKEGAKPMEARFNQAACSEFEALLEDHLPGELSGADAKKLAGNLESGVPHCFGTCCSERGIVALGAAVARPWSRFFASGDGADPRGNVQAGRAEIHLAAIHFAGMAFCSHGNACSGGACDV